MRQATVRIRKLVQNGTITRPRATPRHFGLSFTAIQ